MPNWCSTTMKCRGNGAKELKSLLENSERECMHKTDFGNLWLGNVATAMGLDWEKIPCRGEITEFLYTEVDGEPQLDIQYESAWGPCYELMGEIRNKYGVELTYYAEEFGCCYFATNDASEAQKYIIQVDSEEDGFRTEYVTAEELEHFCLQESGGECHSIDELKKWGESRSIEYLHDKYVFHDDF